MHLKKKDKRYYKLLEDEVYVKNETIDYKYNEDNILKELQEVFQADKKYFGISLGSNTPKRIWDYKKFIDVAKYFEAKGFEIVFFLGPQETHLKEDIINQIRDKNGDWFKDNSNTNYIENEEINKYNPKKDKNKFIPCYEK